MAKAAGIGIADAEMAGRSDSAGEKDGTMRSFSRCRNF
jgi:hypothetical protein